MGRINIKKRGKVYQYCFEAAKVNGKRKQITKSDLKQKMQLMLQEKKHMKNIYKWWLCYTSIHVIW